MKGFANLTRTVLTEEYGLHIGELGGVAARIDGYDLMWIKPEIATEFFPVSWAAFRLSGSPETMMILEPDLENLLSRKQTPEPAGTK